MNKNNKIGHYCGIVGIHSIDKINIPATLFYPLFSLQHRGQESCGIAYHRDDHIITYKDLGMVDQVLSHYLQAEHPSQVGIGHVRYSTSGGNKLENAQPVTVECNKGNIAIAHNGNISNATGLRRELFAEGSIFQSTSDTELLAHLISKSRKNNFEEALIESLLCLEGAFSLVMMHNDSLIAVRDGMGFRPLIMGKKNGLTVFASESCAFDILQIDYVREVEPGEIVIVEKDQVRSIRYTESRKRAQCIFELIYFARPDSKVFGYSVHMMRKKMGAHLAELDSGEKETGEKNKAERIVSPVPDSGNSAALGYSQSADVDFEVSLTRNHYSGRTFIQPSQVKREFGVRVKLNPVREAIQGKKVILIDDSLVRGTTSKIIVKLLKEAGASEVHVRLSSPEIKYPCYYGIDIPTSEELISHKLTPAEIARTIDADSVKFLPVDCLKKCVENPSDFCYGCFSGEYPT